MESTTAEPLATLLPVTCPIYLTAVNSFGKCLRRFTTLNILNVYCITRIATKREDKSKNSEKGTQMKRLAIGLYFDEPFPAIYKTLLDPCSHPRHNRERSRSISPAHETMQHVVYADSLTNGPPYPPAQVTVSSLLIILEHSSLLISRSFTCWSSYDVVPYSFVRPHPLAVAHSPTLMSEPSAAASFTGLNFLTERNRSTSDGHQTCSLDGLWWTQLESACVPLM
ncbi:hypothetical protein GQ600_6250 [Phytophthora cactorum]|nr:hypothetical protein GQ600_6250 [Phytophthora cactorum]